MSALATPARRRAPSIESARAGSARRSLAGLSRALVAAVAREGSSLAVAFTLVDAFATACGAQRVTLACAPGENKPFVPLAMSGQTRVDSRRLLNRRIVEQLERVRAQPADEAGMARHLDEAAAALIFHAAGDSTIGLYLERSAERPFTGAELDLLQAIARDPVGLMRQLQGRERVWWRRVRIGWPSTAVRRWQIATAAIVGLLLVWMPVPMVVKARASIEPRERQIVAAAEPGHLLSAHARAGDRVQAGQLLARLDDRGALLALESWQADAARNAEQLSRALAIRDRTALGELRAEAKRIGVEVDAAQRTLDGARLVAPYDGVLLEGDPARRLGAPVEAGEALFEIAAVDDYRLMLEIDEGDVRLVAAGQLANVRMAGLPDQVWSAELQPLLPVAIAEPGKTAFRMPAALDGSLESLRPGMKGVARIRVGSTTLLAALTRDMRERLMLLAWRVGLTR